MPDVERTVEEQEEEIRILENRIAGLTKRLGQLGKLAGEATKEDVAMTGVET